MNEGAEIPIPPAEQVMSSGMDSIEPAQAKVEAYQKAQDLLSNPEFVSMPTETAIRQLHQIATSSIDWERMKAAAPDSESAALAAISSSFASGQYRDVIRARMGDNPQDSSYLSPEYVAPAMTALGDSVDRLVAECSDDPTDLSPYVLASWAYLNMVSIHPFIDGNGRVGELLMDLICKKTGREPVNINHDRNRLEAAFDNCSANPVVANAQKPATSFVQELKSTTMENILSNRGAIEFTLGILK